MAEAISGLEKDHVFFSTFVIRKHAALHKLMMLDPSRQFMRQRVSQPFSLRSEVHPIYTAYLYPSSPVISVVPPALSVCQQYRSRIWTATDKPATTHQREWRDETSPALVCLFGPGFDPGFLNLNRIDIVHPDQSVAIGIFCISGRYEQHRCILALDACTCDIVLHPPITSSLVNTGEFLGSHGK